MHSHPRAILLYIFTFLQVNSMFDKGLALLVLSCALRIFIEVLGAAPHRVQPVVPTETERTKRRRNDVDIRNVCRGV